MSTINPEVFNSLTTAGSRLVLPEHDEFTPYHHKDWRSRVQAYNIRIPFERIVTIDQGISQCRSCCARYAGNQYQCTATVDYYKTKDREGRLSWGEHRGYKNFGEHDGGAWEYRTTVAQNLRKVCGAHTRWDLQEEFSEQSRFFDMVAALPDPIPAIGGFSEFSHLFPDGGIAAERIQVRMETAQLRAEIAQLKDALALVAQKMDAAGQSLRFK